MDAPDGGPYVRVCISSPLRDNRIEQVREIRRVGDVVVRLWMAAFRRFDAESDAYVAILCGRGWAFWSVADVLQRQSRLREEFKRVGVPTTCWERFQSVN
jgi:hypothetical protein